MQFLLRVSNPEPSKNILDFANHHSMEINLTSDELNNQYHELISSEEDGQDLECILLEEGWTKGHWNEGPGPEGGVWFMLN